MSAENFVEKAKNHCVRTHKNSHVAGLNGYLMLLLRCNHRRFHLLILWPKLNFTDTCRGSYKTCGLCLEQHWMPSSVTKGAKTVSTETSCVFTQQPCVLLPSHRKKTYQRNVYMLNMPARFLHKNLFCDVVYYLSYRNASIQISQTDLLLFIIFNGRMECATCSLMTSVL